MPRRPRRRWGPCRRWSRGRRGPGRTAPRRRRPRTPGRSAAPWRRQGALATSQASAPVHEKELASPCRNRARSSCHSWSTTPKRAVVSATPIEPDEDGRLDAEPRGDHAARDRTDERPQRVRGCEQAGAGLPEPELVGVVRQQRRERGEEERVDEDDRARQVQDSAVGGRHTGSLRAEWMVRSTVGPLRVIIGRYARRDPGQRPERARPRGARPRRRRALLRRGARATSGGALASSRGDLGHGGPADEDRPLAAAGRHRGRSRRLARPLRPRDRRRGLRSGRRAAPRAPVTSRRCWCSTTLGAGPSTSTIPTAMSSSSGRGTSQDTSTTARKIASRFPLSASRTRQAPRASWSAGPPPSASVSGTSTTR